MKKTIIVGLMSLFLVILLTACTKKINIDDDEVIEDEPYVKKEQEELVGLNIAFASPFEKGTLNYIIKGRKVYQNINEAGIDKSLLNKINNIYPISSDLYCKNLQVSDFVNEDGDIVENHQLVVVDLEIQNIDAVGMFKKKEFTISSLALIGGEETVYNPVYFSEGGKVDPEDFFYYSLEQGQSMDVQLGYFVLKEDMKNLVGVIVNEGNERDIQFAIN